MMSNIYFSEINANQEKKELYWNSCSLRKKIYLYCIISKNFSDFIFKRVPTQYSSFLYLLYKYTSEMKSTLTKGSCPGNL